MPTSAPACWACLVALIALSLDAGLLRQRLQGRGHPRRGRALPIDVVLAVIPLMLVTIVFIAAPSTPPP